MRTYRAALLLIVSFALPCITKAQTAHLTAAEAQNHLGEKATVCGHVANARFAEKSKGMPTFLYLDAAYPKQIFTIVIWGTDRPKLGTPERIYHDKNVCATGTITGHLGKPHIIAGKPSQIRIQK